MDSGEIEELARGTDSVLSVGAGPNHGYWEARVAAIIALFQGITLHTYPEVLAAYRENALMVRELLNTSSPSVLVSPGGGTGAIRAMTTNLVEPDEDWAVVDHGYFSGKGVQEIEAAGGRVHRFRVPWGQQMTPELLEENLKARPNVKGIHITVFDSATGVRNPVEEYLNILPEDRYLTIGDAVPLFGGTVIDAKNSPFHALAFSTAKLLGAVVNLGCTWFNRKARLRAISQTSHCRDTSSCLRKLERSWGCEDPSKSAGRYHETGEPLAVMMVNAALRRLRSEGLRQCAIRHQVAVETARRVFEHFGLTPLNSRELAGDGRILLIPVPDGFDPIECIQRARAERMIGYSAPFTSSDWEDWNSRHFRYAAGAFCASRQGLHRTVDDIPAMFGEKVSGRVQEAHDFVEKAFAELVAAGNKWAA